MPDYEPVYDQYIPEYDQYMSHQLVNTEEHFDGVCTGNLGDVLV